MKIYSGNFFKNKIKKDFYIQISILIISFQNIFLNKKMLFHLVFLQKNFFFNSVLRQQALIFHIFLSFVLQIIFFNLNQGRSLWNHIFSSVLRCKIYHCVRRNKPLRIIVSNPIFFTLIKFWTYFSQKVGAFVCVIISGYDTF